MDDRPPATELLGLVRRRRSLVESLAEGASTQADLVADVGASQPTVSRAVTELQSAGLARAENGEYELTRFGRLLLSRYRAFVSDVEELREAADVVAAVPDEVPDSVFLNSTTVTSSRSEVPDNAINPLMELKPRATRVRSCSSVVWTSLVRRVNELIVDHGLECETVVAEDIADVPTPVPETQRRAYRTGRFEMYATTDPIPFDFSITETPEETYVGLVVRTEADTWSTVVTTDEASVEWAEERFERYKRNAEPVALLPDESPTP